MLSSLTFLKKKISDKKIKCKRPDNIELKNIAQLYAKKNELFQPLSEG